MEENYADIYYVDTRNAGDRDHRAGGNGGHGGIVTSGQARRPGGIPAGYSMPVRPVYGSAQQPMVYAPAPMAPSFASSFLGKLTAGQVVEMVAQLFAVLAPLPTAPIATKDAAVDVGNLILFQNALAGYAKRDEQVRTLGGLVGKLVG